MRTVTLGQLGRRTSLTLGGVGVLGGAVGVLSSANARSLRNTANGSPLGSMLRGVSSGSKGTKLVVAGESVVGSGEGEPVAVIEAATSTLSMTALTFVKSAMAA